MPRPWRITYVGALYHVTSRGNGRQRIYYTDADRQRFLLQLEAALEADEVLLYAYVLMPNHYHLLVQTPLGNIKRFMQRLNTAYSMYFRYKHNRPGHCFQGRYGGKLVGGDDYILRLTRYIHLNPIKTRQMQSEAPEKRFETLLDYPWSSLPGYVSKAKEASFVDYRWLALMGSRAQRPNRLRYMEYMKRFIGVDDVDLLGRLDASRYAIGDEAFVDEAESELKEMHLAKACGGGDVYRPRVRTSKMEDVIKVVAASYGINVGDLYRHGHQAGEAKTVAVELK